MDKQETISQLRDMIVEYLKVQGLDLVDLILRHEGNGFILRVLADRPEGGITVDECSRLNISISNLLDERGLLEEGRYTLEISSPGLDRPLKEKSDFLRCIGRRVRLFLNEPVNDKIELEGSINKAEDDSVYIDKGDKVIRIPLVKINKAKQVIE
ncbi:MAG: ribosome maturation factor RimP [Candidatus Omnitrophota bacterium]